MTSGPYLPVLVAAGTAPTSAQLALWTRAIMYMQGTPLSGDDERPLAVLRQTVAQSLPDHTPTPIAFDSEDIDVGGGGHSTSVNTTRWTCPTGKAGWYAVTATHAWATNSTGDRIAWIQVNGTGRYGTNSSPAGATHQTVLCCADTIYLNAGDYVELAGEQYSGGALNTDLTFGCRMSIRQERMQ